MARRKTVTQLALSGALAQHPARHAVALGLEPAGDRPVSKIGDPPPNLTPYECSVWHELAAGMVPGIADASHRVAFEQMVRLLARCRTDPETPVGVQRLLVTLYQQFGMTPLSARQLGAAPAGNPEENEFTEFLPARGRR